MCFALISMKHFNSDKTRNEWLYEITVDNIIALFKLTGNDYPSHGSFTFDTNKRDYIVRSS